MHTGASVPRRSTTAGVPGPRRNADERDAGWFAPVATRRRPNFAAFLAASHGSPCFPGVTTPRNPPTAFCRGVVLSAGLILVVTWRFTGAERDYLYWPARFCLRVLGLAGWLVKVGIRGLMGTGDAGPGWLARLRACRAGFADVQGGLGGPAGRGAAGASSEVLQDA